MTREIYKTKCPIAGNAAARVPLRYGTEVRFYGTHSYSDNGLIYQVSRDAAEEKRVRWRNTCYAYGFAEVCHPDWHTVYQHLRRTVPRHPDGYKPSYLVMCVDQAGHLVHVGIIGQYLNARPDVIVLEG